MNNITINAAVINGQLKTSREHIIIINAVKVTFICTCILWGFHKKTHINTVKL